VRARVLPEAQQLRLLKTQGKDLGGSMGAVGKGGQGGSEGG
jgi:hypothetical protein